MFFNRHARRLGDFAAGTIVIRDQGEVSLDALGQTRHRGPAPDDGQIEAWRLRFPRLRTLTPGDYELIQATLRRHDQGRVGLQSLYRLCDAIAQKIGTEPPAHEWQSSRSFLSDVIAAYGHLAG